MLKQLTLNNKDYVLVETPEEAHHFRICGTILRFMSKYNSRILLPPGSYVLLGKADELSEEVWRGIVEKCESCEIDLFNDYTPLATHWLFTATESAKSLISSLSLQWDRVVVISKI